MITPGTGFNGVQERPRSKKGGASMGAGWARGAMILLAGCDKGGASLLTWINQVEGVGVKLLTETDRQCSLIALKWERCRALAC